MSGKEIEQIPAAEQNEKELASSEGAGIANEIVSQLQDFEHAKKIMPSDTLDRVIGRLDNHFSVSDKERAKVVDQLGEGLQQMVTGELTKLRELMQKNGLDTKDVDAKIKAASEQVEAVKPLQEAVLSGDVKAVQKMLASLKPEQMAQYTELLQKHFDRQGLGIELDYANGQLIVSRSHGDRAVAIGADKTDVIGINNDGSYDFSRQYRHENSGKEFQGMTDQAISNFLFRPYWKGGEVRPLSSDSGVMYKQNMIGHAISNSLESKFRPNGR